MAGNNEWSIFLENLGKVAACSVVLVGVSFCAGYFSLKGYLNSLGAGWFLGFYSATEFVVGGIWYAAFLFFGMVLVLLIAKLSWLPQLYLRVASFILGALVVVIGLLLIVRSGQQEAMSYLGTTWAFALITLVCAINISIAVHDQSGGTPYYRFLGLLSGGSFLACIVVVIPLINGNSSAQNLRNKDSKVMSYVYKVEGEKSFILVSAGGGKMLVVDKDMTTFSVVDPSTVWGVR
ncbi:hypothetical protein [Pseudomonas sp. SR18]|uniref:hypothetical protein n=1 Tax=Pseudomonas sp. SR18 TaxID=1461074 RepID=UPI00203362DB|nr:hypothetical protein [Pseudomonas sp. SR18]MCM2361538.1 hypothetical protein [Pseudomonas sp. SR18]